MELGLLCADKPLEHIHENLTDGAGKSVGDGGRSGYAAMGWDDRSTVYIAHTEVCLHDLV